MHLRRVRVQVNQLRSWNWRKAMSPYDLVKEMLKSQMESSLSIGKSSSEPFHFKHDNRS